MPKPIDERDAGPYDPLSVIEAWGCGFPDGAALACIRLWVENGDVDELREAILYLERLVESDEDVTATVRGLCSHPSA